MESLPKLTDKWIDFKYYFLNYYSNLTSAIYNPIVNKNPIILIFIDLFNIS